jgi:hypothetical protein
MTYVKCYYANGDTIKTRINGTLEQAEAYFIGQTFNIGTIDDNMQECIFVEEV